MKMATRQFGWELTVVNFLFQNTHSANSTACIGLIHTYSGNPSHRICSLLCSFYYARENRLIFLNERNIKWLNGQKEQDHVQIRLTRVVRSYVVNTYSLKRQIPCSGYSLLFYFSAKYSYVYSKLRTKKQLRNEKIYSLLSPS